MTVAVEQLQPVYVRRNIPGSSAYPVLPILQAGANSSVSAIQVTALTPSNGIPVGRFNGALGWFRADTPTRELQNFRFRVRDQSSGIINPARRLPVAPAAGDRFMLQGLGGQVSSTRTLGLMVSGTQPEELDQTTTLPNGAFTNALGALVIQSGLNNPGQFGAMFINYISPGILDMLTADTSGRILLYFHKQYASSNNVHTLFISSSPNPSVGSGLALRGISNGTFFLYNESATAYVELRISGFDPLTNTAEAIGSVAITFEDPTVVPDLEGYETSGVTGFDYRYTPIALRNISPNEAAADVGLWVPPPVNAPPATITGVAPDGGSVTVASVLGWPERPGFWVVNTSIGDVRYCNFISGNTLTLVQSQSGPRALQSNTPWAVGNSLSVAPDVDIAYDASTAPTADATPPANSSFVTKWEEIDPLEIVGTIPANGSALVWYRDTIVQNMRARTGLMADLRATWR